MHATGARIIVPELLDDAPREEARHSLRDLVRINRYLGGHRVALGIFRRLVKRDEAFSVLDVGAASGDLGDVLRRYFPRARITAFDYEVSHLERACAPKIAGDAFQMPFAAKSFDFVMCSLFLHHFEDQRVIELLASFRELARRAVIVFDLERGPFAYRFLPMTQWLFRWHPLTLHDGPISVEAAFKKHELAQFARAAGFSKIDVRQHRPWARLSMVAQ